MRRIAAILVLLIFALAVTSCANEGKTESPGETASGQESSAPERYAIRYELGDAAGHFTSAPKEATAGETVEIKTEVLYDADIHVYADGQELAKTHDDSDYHGYSFIMPQKDVLITARFYSKEEIWGTGSDELSDLKEKYPEYFGLPTDKGLEVYVWQMAPGSYSFGLLPGTNREKTEEELLNLKGADAQEMRAILSSYGIDEDRIVITPWQALYSSYISEYWIVPEGEDPAATEKRREDYIAWIRNMLLPSGEEPAVPPETKPSEEEPPEEEPSEDEPSEEEPPEDEPSEEEPSEDEPPEDRPPQEEPSEEEPSEEEPPEEEPPEVPEGFPVSLPEDADAVACVSASGSYGELQFYGRGENGFELQLSCSAFVGREGVGQANAWSTRTPAGLYPLQFAFGVNPDPGCPVGYTQVDDTHYWVGDSDSPYYNQFISTRDVAYEPTPDDEHLIEYTNSYAYAVWIAYNSEGTPGAGSAFFLHCENGYPTAGCVAVGREEMVFILRHLTENTYIYITGSD